MLMVSNANMLDHETTGSYMLMVTAGGATNTNPIILNITVTDVDYGVTGSFTLREDDDTAFQAITVSSSYTIDSIATTAVAGRSKGGATVATDSAAFISGGVDGIVIMATRLDFEIVDSYTLTVSANISGGTEGLSNDRENLSVTVTIEDFQDGSEAEAWKIANAGELQSIDTGFNNAYRSTALSAMDSLTQHYQLTNDIDLASITNFDPLGSCDSSGCFASETNDLAFRGVLDGAGYTISNLKINRGSTNGIGLIADNRGTMRNIHLTAVMISNGQNQVGGLVGNNSATVLRSYATGDITNSSDDTYTVEAGTNTHRMGALVGSNDLIDPDAGNGIIWNSYATGNISCIATTITRLTRRYIGGLAAKYQDISNSFATGNLECSESMQSRQMTLGGLRGGIFGSVRNSYATGNVTTSTDTSTGDVNTTGLSGVF